MLPDLGFNKLELANSNSYCQTLFFQIPSGPNQIAFFTLCRNQTKIVITARPRDTRILVPEKNRTAQNRAS